MAKGPPTKSTRTLLYIYTEKRKEIETYIRYIYRERPYRIWPSGMISTSECHRFLSFYIYISSFHTRCVHFLIFLLSSTMVCVMLLLYSYLCCREGSTRYLSEPRRQLNAMNDNLKTKSSESIKTQHTRVESEGDEGCREVSTLNFGFPVKSPARAELV